MPCPGKYVCSLHFQALTVALAFAPCQGQCGGDSSHLPFAPRPEMELAWQGRQTEKTSPAHPERSPGQLCQPQGSPAEGRAQTAPRCPQRSVACWALMWKITQTQGTALAAAASGVREGRAPP